MPNTDIPGLHPDLQAISFLLGKWAGEGQGDYPTASPFPYGEETTYSHMGKAFIAYTQRSWSLDDGRPLHTEMGYWRCPAPGRVELIVAHPTGHAEVSEGTVEGGSVCLGTTGILAATSAKEVSGLSRRIVVNGDELTYELEMAAVGYPLTGHLRAVLRRVSGH
jgi:hypothetical protein